MRALGLRGLSFGLSLITLAGLSCSERGLPAPSGPHYELSLEQGSAKRRAGWLQVERDEAKLSVRRALRLSQGGSVARSRYLLLGADPDERRVSWSYEVAGQRSSGEVTLRCEGSGAETQAHSCAVTFHGEGGSRTSHSETRPLFAELWPWQLAEEGCGAGSSSSVVRPLVRPLSAQLELEGISLSCLSAQEAPAGVSATWGARYESQGERGRVWWSEGGLALWEAQTGALTWRLQRPSAEEPLVEVGGSLSLEQLAMVPISAQPSPPQAERWAHIKWARLKAQRGGGEPVRLLESSRQTLDQNATGVTRVTRGARLGEGPREPQGPEPLPPLSARAGTPAYPVSSARIKALIEEVAPASLAPRRRAQALWSWVRSQVKVEARAGLPRVLETLESLAGDCNEQSALLTTMYRAAGLPAEQVFGLVALGPSAGYHAWVRVWLSGRWVEVDPARGLDYVTAGHWAISAGDERAQGALRPLLLSARVTLSSWSKGSP